MKIQLTVSEKPDRKQSNMHNIYNYYYQHIWFSKDHRGWALKDNSFIINQRKTNILNSLFPESHKNPISDSREIHQYVQLTSTQITNPQHNHTPSKTISTFITFIENILVIIERSSWGTERGRHLRIAVDVL